MKGNFIALQKVRVTERKGANLDLNKTRDIRRRRESKTIQKKGI